MTSREVSGSDKTLKQAIEDGDVEPPPLLEWNKWQKWRRDVGKRPSLRVDGGTTSNTEEAALWKRTMEDRYGSDWATQLMTQVAETEAPEEAEAAVQSSTVPSAEPASASAPLAPPPPTDTERPATPRARLTQISPGSGDVPILGSPGSGAQSPAPSWTSGSPGTPGTMMNRLGVPYDPKKEPMERYLERAGRIVAALASLGRPCDDGVLELLHAEAAVTLTIFEAAPDNVGEQNARLQEEFAIQFLEIDGTAGQFVKIQALENVMMRRGMDPTRIRRDLTVGDPTSVGGAEFSVQDGGARPLGTAASAGRTLPPFPTGTGQAQTFELTPPKDLTLGPRSQDAEIERLRKIVQQQEAEKAAARLLQPPLMSASPSGQATPVTTGTWPLSWINRQSCWPKS